MSDIECPYCGAEQNICNDDGHGLEEGVPHEEQCGECEKYFVFNTHISISYSAYKADCLNGKPHKYKPVVHIPKYWPDWKRCKVCGDEVRGKHKEPKQEARDAD